MEKNYNLFQMDVIHLGVGKFIMSTEIYYISGTGNSQHLAKEMQKRIPETELIPIVSLFDDDIIKTSGKAVGFVFPVHVFLTIRKIKTGTLQQMKN